MPACGLELSNRILNVTKFTLKFQGDLILGNKLEIELPSAFTFAKYICILTLLITTLTNLSANVRQFSAKMVGIDRL